MLAFLERGIALSITKMLPDSNIYNVKTHFTNYSKIYSLNVEGGEREQATFFDNIYSNGSDPEQPQHIGNICNSKLIIKKY